MESNYSPYKADLEHILRKGLASNRGAKELLNLIQYGSINGVQTARITIPAASVATLNATPVSIIAAQSGKAVVVSSVTVESNAGVAYDACAAGKFITLSYVNASGAVLASVASNNADLNLDSASAGSCSMAVSQTALNINAAVVCHVTTGEVYSAAGDKDVTLIVSYYLK